MNSPKRVTNVGGSDPHVRGDLAFALHEVSNALTAVLGWLQRTRGQLQPGSEARDAADVAYSHARLAYSVAREAIGAPIAEGEDVRSAAMLARDALKGVTQAASRKSLHLEFVGDDQDALLCDSSSAHQVLLNLLLNAVAFSPEQGVVRLSLRNFGQQVSFVVADQGPGVAPERAATLFTARHSTRPGGAGIGLRYSKALANEKGGELSLLEHDDAGAQFELRWPSGDAPSTTLQKAPRSSSLAGLKVLVLEDDAALSSLLEFGLSASGVDFIGVQTLDEFKQFFQNGASADVALVDLSPGSRRPSEALLILHSHCDPTPLVVMSGHIVDSIPGVHVAGWLRKPFELAEVLDTLGRVSGRISSP